MSSGFVSAGTDQEPVERDDEWLRVQQELEEERRRKAELGKQADGKSLYEVLQQNKNSIMESTRAQEAAVKKETAEQLEAFRRHREEAEKVALEEGTADVTPAAEGEDWKIPARKRRRDKKDLLFPGKKRKSTAEVAGETLSTGEQKVNQKDREPGKVDKQSVSIPAEAVKAEKSQPSVSAASSVNPVRPGNAKVAVPEQTEKKPAAKPAPIALGLSGYSSDSE
ncbi:unnamed protein product [Aspergillus oryzae RIB40]|uniref:DNA, SC038 n=1 Tax=Aspergillus oryzae (strain ATCC 42149 / RIB 40) TaxID=510516 RepID=Q2U2G8_ASPOR|nr:unnamed protein product [Aspergillus oryzae RIB40]BAE64247.1 unnamed protein product [Aspergillus oryzae RIB40]